MRRRTIAIGLTVVVVGAASGGWIAARSIRSPEEAAARQAPPAASRITVPVVRKELASTLITRGTVRFGEPKQVLLPSSAIKAGTSQVVTAPATTGASVAEGGKLMEIGGRPVLALQGETPMYRDLRPGDTGTDVHQLEAALARLGFDPGKLDGTYDSNTETAVEHWYRALGQEAFGPTDAQRTALANAQEAASKAADSLRQAQQSLTDARTPPTADKLLQAAEQVATAQAKVDGLADEEAKQRTAARAAVDARTVALLAAQQTLDDARATAEKATTDAADNSPVDDARANLEKAKAALVQAERATPKAQQTIADAQTAVDDATQGLTDAQASEADAIDNLARAQQALDTAKATPAKTISLGNGQYTSDEEGRKATIAAAEATLRQAQSALRAAQANTRQAQRTLDAHKLAIDDANNAVPVAAQTIKDAQSALARSQNDATKADQTMADRRRAITAAQTKLAQAAQGLRQAQLDLDQARAAVTSVDHALVETRRSSEGQLRIAQAAQRTTTRPASTSSIEAQVASARQAQARADADLADLETKVGIVVPANEVVFFPTLPLRVDSTTLTRGDVASGAVMTVSTSRLAVDASLDLADAQLARVGDKVQIDSSDFDISLPGHITKLATTPGTDGVDATKVYMEVTPDSLPDATPPPTNGSGETRTATDAKDSAIGAPRQPGLDSLNGQSVKVTLPVRSTGGPVLAVPTPAVSAAADGTSRVEVEDAPDRPTRFVTVKVGLAAEGLVAVTPVRGALTEGMQVVIGTDGSTDVTGVVEPNDKGGTSASNATTDTTIASATTETTAAT